MEHTRLKKYCGGIAAVVALMFVATPLAVADDGSKTTSGKGQVSAQRDTGWGR
jgi:hypothetical protein